MFVKLISAPKNGLRKFLSKDFVNKFGQKKIYNNEQWKYFVRKIGTEIVEKIWVPLNSK